MTVKTYTPKKSNGSTFDKIPGTFIGTTSNTAKIDKSPVIGISNTNLKHYQTWADLNHIQVYAGNPQLVLEGLPRGWNKTADASQPGAEKATDTGVTVKVDAATALTLEGENATAKLLQIDTNSMMHYRTLDVLDASMMEQGARIKAISTKAGVESAEALKIRSSAAMSKLASIVANVEQALGLLLDGVGEFMGTTVSSKITINRDFFTPEPDGPLLGALSEAEAIGTAPRGTTITYLKQIELVSDKDKTEDLLKDMELNIAQLGNDIGPDGKPIREDAKPKPKTTSTDVK